MKTKLKVALQTVILFLFAGLFACKDDCPTYYVHPEALAYGAFREGSWWIYQDDSTGVRDCLYVEKVNNYFQESTIDKKCQYKNQVIFSILDSKKNIFPIFYNIHASENITFVGVEYHDTHQYGFWLFGYSGINFTNSEYYNITESYTNFVYLNYTFEKLLKISSKSSLDTNRKAEFWIAPKVGIIKIISKDFITPNISLVEYNTLPYE
jgi:hypothetical protein